MNTDSLNVWFKAGFYHVRYDGKIKTFSDFVDAKEFLDGVMQSVWFRKTI